MIKTDVLFTGYYGQYNTGDDAFVEVSSWGANHFWKRNRNRFLAIKSKLPKTVIPVKGYPFTLPKTYNLQSRLLLKNTHCLISSGGSTIHSKMAANNPKQIALNLKRSDKRIKVGAIGVSVGPFKTAEDELAVQNYLRDIDFIALRDQHSFDYVASLDTPYKPVKAFDLAALLPEIYNYGGREPVVRTKKIIGISVCPVESIQKGMDISNEIRRNTMLVSLLKEIDKNIDVHYRFFIINGNKKNGDRNLTMETIEKVAPRSFDLIEYSSATKNIWQSIANCDFMLSTRLHAAIFSCFADIPFMLNEYHRKCADFLKDVGYEDGYRLYDSDYDIKEQAQKIAHILYDRYEYLSSEKVKEAIVLARRNFTHINI